MNIPTDAKAADQAEPGGPDTRWQTVWGVLLVIGGILALLMPAVAAVANVLLLAWLLIFGGAFEIIYAIQTRRAKGFGARRGPPGASNTRTRSPSQTSARRATASSTS